MFCKFNFRLCLLVALITNIYSSNLNTDLNNTEKKIVESKEANLEANLKIDGNKSKDKSKASLDGYKKVNNKDSDMDSKLSLESKTYIGNFCKTNADSIIKMNENENKIYS